MGVHLCEPRQTISPWRGWVPLVFLPVAILLFTPGDWPRWALMWLLALGIYTGCKWLTWRRTPDAAAPWWRHLGYWFAWPGMDADAFLRLKTPQAVQPPSRGEWSLAIAKTCLGAAVLAAVLGQRSQVPALLAGWAGMVGLLLLLHFGFFHLLSCAWRAVGIDARPIMRAPLASVSLGEFWGRRWNAAFRDLIYRFLFRPLTPQLGARGAVAIGFLFSGLLHDLVISFPAGGGYGGPTLYFVLQGAGLLTERSTVGRALGLGRGWRGRLFVALLLVVPVCTLFHPPFVTRVMVPFLHACAEVFACGTCYQC